ncbi:hypothetical protein J2X11_001668 [Aeromicrobium panaciterrae]|uniref:PD-(D/E)XK nuclease superfamily protein n=1 Tax=Aeromicrobium panaciterrae TaxID=363861 RepID=A0ABU1UNS5_9ACTN|nr:hypothetical protein [Aeromicrobium panaciterrae]MDR7086829.1 hypothetical protein [Aeromicrobium panaciterrae]
MPDSPFGPPPTLPASNVPGHLLASLLSAGSLVQPEPVLTRAVRFLLGLPGASSALDELVRKAGLEPGQDGYWLTEVGHDDGGRTDLEYWWGEKARVIVEAKIGHTLEASQLDGYRSRLPSAGGLLVVLVPTTRTRESSVIVESLRARYSDEGDTVGVALWTWDDVARQLESALGDSSDVAQLRGLIAAAGALDVMPFTTSQLDVADSSRVHDLWRVLDRASFGLFDHVLPMQHRGPFERWRFVSVGGYDASFKVGLGRRNRGSNESWIWASVDEVSRFGRAAQEALLARFDDAIRDGREIAIPIPLTAGLSGVELEEDIREKLFEIAATIREGIASGLAELAEHEAGAPAEVPHNLVGIPPFTKADLLDTSDRRADLELVTRAALRHVFDGKPVRLPRSEPFAKRCWIGIAPFGTHISIGIERTDGSHAQDWVWISVHEATPSSALAYRVLDELFPGETVDIPRGRGLPAKIPEGSNGVEAFLSLVAQIEQTKRAVLEALVAASPA